MSIGMRSGRSVVTGWEIGCGKQILKGLSWEDFFEGLKDNGIKRLWIWDLSKICYNVVYELMSREYRWVPWKDEVECDKKVIKTLFDSMGGRHRIKFTLNGIWCEICNLSSIVPLKDAIEMKSWVGERNEAIAAYAAMRKVKAIGVKGTTLSSSALARYKSGWSKRTYSFLYPLQMADQELRPYYKGGYCWLNPKWAKVEVRNFVAYDCNDAYGYQMRTKNLPVGHGRYFKGEYKSDKIFDRYLQCIECYFRLKEGRLPCVSAPNDLWVAGDMWLESSGGKRLRLFLADVELELFFENYEVIDIDYVDGWKYRSMSGNFEQYVEEWEHLKEVAKASKDDVTKRIAKRMIVALYGKMGQKPEVRPYIPSYNHETGEVTYYRGKAEARRLEYLPAAIFITAEQRVDLVRYAQNNFNRFVYCDTDSVFLVDDSPPIGLPLDDIASGSWKLDKQGVKGVFLKPKTYGYEDNNGEFRCVIAGAPDSSKNQLTLDNFKEGTELEIERWEPGKGGGVFKKYVYKI